MSESIQEREAAWQKRWRDAGVFRLGDVREAARPMYVLEMFPYPSGRIHMGHVRNYSIGDALARFYRMQGWDVLHPIGWDAFGLPAENAALKMGRHPADWTYENIRTMRSQLQKLGFSYDWSREIATCRPEYYKFEQRVFLQMLERGLAYRRKTRVNWCQSCETVLANEQVIEGKCWRCDSQIQQKDMNGWFLKITAYAEELLRDIDSLTHWPEKVRVMQRNWIGRSEGVRVRFPLIGAAGEIEIFTTRPDTLYGVTYIAVSPEREDLWPLLAPSERTAVQKLRDEVRRGVHGETAKVGFDSGLRVRHPLTGESVPVWFANFVLIDYGTGAIMSVPAHDQRDFEFAMAYGLPVRVVIQPPGGGLNAANMTEAFTGAGMMVDSGPFSGLESETGKARIGELLERIGWGERTVTWRLRDWGVSRQRYWGCPIPVIHCDRCGIVPVPESELPVTLPVNVKIGRGNPLDGSEEFWRVPCPRCRGAARRETDTFDTFMESSWYFFRYLSPRDESRMVDREAIDRWFPVNHYIGGVEHAVLHLLYARFYTKVLRDLGIVGVSEPFRHLLTQGMVIKDGAKMSKSKGNVVDPDEMVARYGADTTRLFVLFAAPPEKDLDWQESGVEGMSRFLARVERVAAASRDAQAKATTAGEAGAPWAALERALNRTIVRMTADLGERLQLNTAIAALMEFSNQWIQTVSECPVVTTGDAAVASRVRNVFARLLAPFAPHLAETLWADCGGQGFVAQAEWPQADTANMHESTVEIAVQVNGKLRGRIHVERTMEETGVLEAARSEPNVRRFLEGSVIVKEVIVPGKLVNFVVRPHG